MQSMERLRRHAGHGHTQKAIALHTQMTDKGLKVDKVTYNSLILGHFKAGKLSKVSDIVNNMRAKGLVPKADTYNLLVKGYCELKDFTEAYSWYREMFDNGFHILGAEKCLTMVFFQIATHRRSLSLAFARSVDCLRLRLSPQK